MGVSMKPDAAARIFASHYQLVICDDPTAFTEDTNWTDEDVARGYAGNRHFRMVGTEADLNDHWVEVELAEAAPALEPWERVTCVDLECSSGKIHIMSIIDDEAPISLEVERGPYAVYVAGCNLGIDQNSLGEDEDLSDQQLAERKDLEWYRIFLVPGPTTRVGRVKG